MNYVHYVTSPLLKGPRYGSGRFVSPMKEMNERTVLVENSENHNDSYRHKTKYDDKVDRYFSTYDLGILLQNEESCLYGRLQGDEDVDYYSFMYGQRGFYEKMGIETKITIRLENIPKDCDYDLIVYDGAGNQIGIAKADGNRNKELILPDWEGGSNNYTIKVENHGHGKVNAEESYRIRIVEEKRQGQEKTDSGLSYEEKLDGLHQEQYALLPKEERYAKTKSAEELLKEMALGKPLNRQEEAYLKIFASLQDYERAAAYGRMRNTLYPKIQKALEEAGIDLREKTCTAEIDIYGKITVTGGLSEEEKRKAERILEEQFSEKLWDCHMQASEFTKEEFNRINAYKEISGFLEKSTGGQYSWKDIWVDGNGKISGLPEKMCRLFNSQESNGKYEQLRDDIFMLWDYGKAHGMGMLYKYKAGYEITGSDIKIING